MRLAREKQKPPGLAVVNLVGSTPGTLQVTVVVSDESDFTPDIHQVIPSEPCYGLPLVAKDDGGSELNYSEAVEVQDFQGIYYFKSGCL